MAGGISQLGSGGIPIAPPRDEDLLFRWRKRTAEDPALVPAQNLYVYRNDDTKGLSMIQFQTIQEILS